jgi:putative peptidoglycan lipid II flippase
VLRAAITVGGISFAVKVVSVVKEGVVAYRIGTAPELDAFLLAYAFPLFFLNVLSGSLSAAFVPVYVRVRSAEGESAANRLALRLTWQLVVALVVATLLLTPLSSGAMQLIVNFDPGTLDLATTLIYVLMPVLVLNGLTGFWSGFLNARSQFAIAAIAPLCTPVLVMLALLSLWDTLGVYTIVLGTLAGGAAELFAVGWAAKAQGLPIFSFPRRSAHRGERVLSEFFGAAGGNVLIGATVLVDQAMAATLATGSVAVLGYGIRVPNALLSIGTMALATALLPQLSELVANRRFDELRDLLRRYSILTLAISIPATLLLVTFSVPLVEMLFRRGSFTADDVNVVADVQSAFAIQIPFFAWSIIAVRLLSALQANRYLVVGSAISLVLDVILNLVLSAYFGVIGIALATSIVYMVSCAFLWMVAMNVLRTVVRITSLQTPKPVERDQTLSPID